MAIIAVSALAAVEGLQGYGASMFTPEIARTLQVGVVSVIGARALALVLATVLPAVIPRLSAMLPQTAVAWVCRVTGVATALTFAFTGLVRGTGGFVAVLCITAILSAPSRALSRSVVAAAVEPARRVSGLSALQGGLLAGQMLLALAATVGTGTSWHRLIAWVGAVAVVAALLAAGLLSTRAMTAGGLTSTNPPGQSVHAEQSWKEIVRAWRVAPSLVGIAVALLAAGLLLMPFDAVLAVYLHGRWQFGMRGTGFVFLVMSAAGLLAVIGNATRSDALLVSSPATLVSRSTTLLALGAVLLGFGALSPVRSLMVVGLSLGSAAIATLVPALASLAFGVVPARQHSAMSSAVAGTLSAGSLIGVVYATSFENRHGPRWALVAMVALALIAAAWLRMTSRAATDDLQRRWDTEGLESRRLATRARGSELLECRAVDFSYGSLQVLHNIDFTVREGEIVALLGTNGAGKSTLLRVISGLCLPQRGSVALAGRDITFLDPEDRVGAGITQISGGHAVFGSMDVVENLKCFGYSLGRDRRTVDEAIARSLAAFPQLTERRSSLAATLSGGEQQMLGLAKALMLRPRVLLVDELALGLAPVVVGPLLDMVRRINSEGTAVVIVEQSVNIALSLVDRAYFMEKGTIRFEGRARDLLDRRDLLRAVFLEGAAKAALE
jgi:ABC-type branched-subunit amino acid transport system ATPase component